MTHRSVLVEGVPPFILASASPRRSELLDSVGLDFRIVPSNAEEPAPGSGESPEDYAVRMAVLKAREVATRYPGSLILAADTVVALGDEILGKPSDEADALRMLEALCGSMNATAEERVAGVRRHAVTTGCCWLDGRGADDAGVQDGAVENGFFVTTQVLMSLTDTAVLERYIATGEPMDKAGSYAIQGKAGFLVRAIDGSYSNVVGLPLAEVVEAMAGDAHF
ncbi:septum formation protein Maf [Oceanidesulfovibrio indonesiensis]|uniref:dTTP/UTP pyrophosphatase n=1 Tax=Oceanidesulfovibrio indonesiensis TaxID=54767 RepID=A0A7M3MHU1_9BACT|nr:Maf family protein [Oceanidesulfovibrio indonesiensis]TVM18820.1 septum formation protein Maf [Oceanidesulfovibrio indonesiensis]